MAVDLFRKLLFPYSYKSKSGDRNIVESGFLAHVLIETKASSMCLKFMWGVLKTGDFVALPLKFNHVHIHRVSWRLVCAIAYTYSSELVKRRTDPVAIYNIVRAVLVSYLHETLRNKSAYL